MFSTIEGPDDEIYCTVCYRKYWGPGGKNKFGEKSVGADGEEGDEDCCVRCGGHFSADLVHKTAINFSRQSV